MFDKKFTFVRETVKRGGDYSTLEQIKVIYYYDENNDLVIEDSKLKGNYNRTFHKIKELKGDHKKELSGLIYNATQGDNCPLFKLINIFEDISKVNYILEWKKSYYFIFAKIPVEKLKKFIIINDKPIDEKVKSVKDGEEIVEKNTQNKKRENETKTENIESSSENEKKENDSNSIISTENETENTNNTITEETESEIKTIS